MTTSLAALAATNSAHSPSTVLMSTNLNSNNQLSSPVQKSSNQDLTDSNNEIKTEFYTREGLWKLVTNCEYVRQQQLNQSLNSNSPIQSSNNTQTNSINQNNLQTNNQNSTLNQNYSNTTSNDPVKIGLFKFSKKLIFKELYYMNRNETLRKKNSLLCDLCKKEKLNEKKMNENDKNSSDQDEDDDNDVIFTQLNKINENYDEISVDNDDDDDDDEDENNINRYNICKTCKLKLIENKLYGSETSDENDDKSDTESEINNSKNRIHNKQPGFLDLIIFNYARDIYTYEFNSITTKNEMKNLMDKKSYKTVQSTCFDINKTATISNTSAFQLAKQNTSTASTTTTTPNNNNNNNASNLDYKSINFSISPQNLSLIVAAGFNKGEIHVFDVFKKDASVFYNNSKLVDKSKVTCIKWVPNSVNLFLVGYSSGNIYLYDAFNQTQSTVAPSYTKLCQNESFSIFINNNSSTLTSTINENQTNTSSTSLNNLQTPKKLVFSNNNQQSQVAKNPLLKLTIGPPESSYGYGVNGVNEFEFSPCGNYLAVVSQDGYLRVFSFVYKNNQQMQLQLICSMKSYFGGLLCVCWSPDGKYIATGGEDDMITVFSFVEMRVACRGRGHSSWINSCSFDSWAKLSNYSSVFMNLAQSNQEQSDQENESDLEGFHSKQRLETEKKLETMNLNSKNKITAPKKRTISTQSDFNNSSSFNNQSINNNSIFYRLASVGQDNQICFWDLTEDVLKEKLTHHNSRSRVTSMILNNTVSTINNFTVNTLQQSQHQQQKVPQIVIQSNMDTLVKDKSHSTASSIVSTARNLFSSKNSSSDKLQKYSEQVNNDCDDSNQATTNNKSTLTGSFFKRHKRNSSLNSAQSFSSEGGKSKNNSKNSPIVLNSYKKSANPYSPISTEYSITNNSNNSGVDSLNTKKNNNFLHSSSKQFNLNPFNLCPKLEEVPLIEPLICKRISTERLTSVCFKKDCFIVATQDGFIHTWARPKKVYSVSSQNTNFLPKLTNHNQINSTSL